MSELFAIYQAVHLMMAKLGADGEIDTRAPEVDAVMNALHDYDGGEYRRPPQPVTPAGGEVYLMEPENVADESLPLIQLFGGVCIDGKTFYHRTIGAPWPFHPPAADAALAETIVRDACETDPADPDASDTICISSKRLRLIVDAALNQRGGGCTDGQCDAIYEALDAWANEVDPYDFGLPHYAGGGKEAARDVIRKALAAGLAGD